MGSAGLLILIRNLNISIVCSFYLDWIPEEKDLMLRTEVQNFVPDDVLSAIFFDADLQNTRDDHEQTKLHPHKKRSVIHFIDFLFGAISLSFSLFLFLSLFMSYSLYVFISLLFLSLSLFLCVSLSIYVFLS